MNTRPGIKDLDAIEQATDLVDEAKYDVSEDFKDFILMPSATRYALLIKTMDRYQDASVLRWSLACEYESKIQVFTSHARELIARENPEFDRFARLSVLMEEYDRLTAQ